MSNLTNNKMIAAFMGHELIPRKNSGWLNETHYKSTNFPITYFRDDNNNWNTNYCRAKVLLPRQLAYHKDWNWVMPVVRKIVDFCVNENEDAFMSDEYTSILDTVSLATIEDTYRVVVDFVNYYNNNLK